MNIVEPSGIGQGLATQRQHSKDVKGRSTSKARRFTFWKVRWRQTAGPTLSEALSRQALENLHAKAAY